MEAETRTKTDRRLARLEGQVRGIRRMLSEDAYCCDVLQQISAITSALNQVAAAVAASHIRTCILDHGSPSSHEQTKTMTREEMIDELEDVMSRLVRA
ncbi:MAG: metal-sensitive transcriptional regulator [Fimbriimonadaceae bacterium]|nr:metal-sensitive transcriptional regulator [Fimbriimonadaceae bacterium]